MKQNLQQLSVFSQFISNLVIYTQIDHQVINRMKKHNKSYCTGSLANLHGNDRSYKNKQLNLTQNPSRQQSELAKDTKYQIKVAQTNSYLDVFQGASQYSVLSSQNTKKKGYQKCNQHSSRKQFQNNDHSLQQKAFLKRKIDNQFDQGVEQLPPRKTKNIIETFSIMDIKQIIHLLLLQDYQYQNAQFIQQFKKTVNLQETIKMGMQMAVRSKFRYFQQSNRLKQTNKNGRTGDTKTEILFESFGGNQAFKSRPIDSFQKKELGHCTNITTKADETSSTDYYSFEISEFQESMLSQENRIRMIRSCKNPDVHYELLKKIADKNGQLEEREQLLYELKERVQQVQSQKLKYKLKIQKMQGYIDSYSQKINQLHLRINLIERGNQQFRRSPYQSDMDISYDDIQSSRMQKNKSHANIFSQRNQKSYSRVRQEGCSEATIKDGMHKFYYQESPANSGRTLNELSLKLQRLQKRAEKSGINSPSHSSFSKSNKNKGYSKTYQNSPNVQSPRSRAQTPPMYKQKISELQSQIESLEVMQELNQLRDNQSILLDKLKQKDEIIDKLIQMKTESIQNLVQQYNEDSFAVTPNQRQNRQSSKLSKVQSSNNII